MSTLSCNSKQIYRTVVLLIKLHSELISCFSARKNCTPVEQT